VSEVITHQHLLSQGVERLRQLNIPNAQLDGRLLLQFATGLSHAQLIVNDNDAVSHDVETRFLSLLERRIGGEPVHRILGARAFYGLEFKLSEATLEPRPDTECLVDAVVERLRDSGRNTEELLFADLGTGTGAVGLALLSALPNAHALLTDISGDALRVAEENASGLELSSRVSTIQTNWLAGVEDKFHFIVSNPPYIASEVVDQLEPEVLNHDPRRALDGGNDGLDAYRAILAGAKSRLAPQSFLAVEIGFDQAQELAELANEFGWKVDRVIRDLGDRDRAVVLEPR